MTYTRGEPNRDDQGLTSQPKLLANNDGIDDIFGIDHYMFSSTVNDRGKHKTPRFKDQTADGDPTTASDEFALFAKQDDDSNIELFVRRPSNGTVYQLTKDGLLFTGLFPAAAINFTGGVGPVAQSNFNASTVVRDSTGKYTITFDTPLPNNDYEWSIQGIGSDIIYASILPNATYNNSVNTNFIKVQFVNAQTGSLVDPIRGSVIIFRRIG